jgi:GNAT superfamily N-acetyltransferase
VEGTKLSIPTSYHFAMPIDPDLMIRRAGANDQDRLYPLASELSTSFAITPTSFATSFSRLVADPDALVLVAADGRSDQLIGYLLGFRHETFFACGAVGWVEEIYTVADRRRAGIAGALMSEFEQWAWESGARMIALATRRAPDFFSALGYEESATYFRKLAPH